MSSDAAYACDELQKEEGQRLLLAAGGITEKYRRLWGLARVVAST